jgi:hypothetical protein
MNCAPYVCTKCGGGCLTCRSCGRSLCLGDAGLSMVAQADDSTPLYVASKEGHLTVVKALLRAGVAVSEAMVRDDGLHTCRMLALGRWPCMRAVIRDAYVECLCAGSCGSGMTCVCLNILMSMAHCWLPVSAATWRLYGRPYGGCKSAVGGRRGSETSCCARPLARYSVPVVACVCGCASDY